MNSVLVFALIPIILSIGIIPVFAEHAGNHHGKKMIDRMSDKHHHMSFNGICAPGFAALNKMCVLDDRCGPGAYPGKICMMDGAIKQYLKPHHQKHAGISVDNIICAEGKELIFKNHNASPACVNSDSVEKLKHRGWQTEKPVIACTMEYNPVCGVDGATYGNMCGLNSQHMKIKHHGECTATPSITNFEQCIAAGNPAMESHPRQCRTTEGDHFVEEITMQEMGKIFPNTLEDTEKILAMDEFAGILNKLNQNSISYQNNSNQKEFEKNKVLMSKKQAEIASKILKVDISDAYVAEGWNFPFRDISEVNIINPEFNKPICNIPERIPYHLQKIQQSEMFQIFVGKYSGYELKIDISDERNHEGLIHYDLIATSESESFTASTYFHLYSCTEEMKWAYFLWCKDNQKDEHISTKNKVGNNI